MNISLAHELAQHIYLREKLETDFPEVDREDLRDTLEGLTTLPEMLAAILRTQLEDVVFAAALKARLSDMQERLARIEEKAEKKRALVTSVMERADIRKITEPDFTVSLRPLPPPLLITDESAIPQTYWKPQPAKLDRRAIAAALNAGLVVTGAGLGNGGVTISVRTK